MAITRLWQTGAEIGNMSEFDVIYNGFTVGLAYTGTWGYDSFDQYRRGLKTIPATRQVRLGCFIYGTLTQTACNYISLRSSADAELVGLFFHYDGTVYIRTGGVNRDTLLGGNEQAWRHWALDIKLASSGGWAKAYKGGNEVLSYTGNTGSTDITRLYIGREGSGSSQQHVYYDNIYIDDTTGEGAPNPPPVLTFPYIVPNGNGFYSGWTGSDGDSVNNYLLVDERPPSTADRVTASGVDQYDSYAMGGYTIGAGEKVLAVIPTSYAQRASTTELLALGTRYSSTDVVGSGISLNAGSYSTFWDRQTTKPGGGDWNQDAITNMELVVKSEGTY